MPQRATTAQPTQPARVAQGTSEIRVPTNEAELAALHQVRGELREQLRTLTGLRQDLTNQVAQAHAVGDDAALRRLQERTRNLDARSASLEQQMLQVDDAVRAGVARGVAAGPSEAATAVSVVPSLPPPIERPADMIDENVLVSSLMGLTLLFVFLGALIHRRAWRRAEKQFAAAGAGRADMQQLQQAVDVIAVEVERISEGQRFVSKLLNERLDVPLLPDAKERVPVPLKDADSTSRR